MKLRKLSFPLVVALAISTSAQAAGDKDDDFPQGKAYGHDKQYQSDSKHASDQGRNGNAYGHDKKASDEISKEDVEEAVKLRLREAAGAYEKAWQQPVKQHLLEALKEYHAASLAALKVEHVPDDKFGSQAHLERRIDRERERIEAHFEEIEEEKSNAKEAKANLYKASAAYKEAWKKPEKAKLISTLKVYHEAALAALAADDDGVTFIGKTKVNQYFTAELKRIETHFHTLEKLEAMLADIYKYFNSVAGADVETKGDLGELRKKLKERHKFAKDILDKLDNHANVDGMKKALEASYEGALRRIETINDVRKRTTKGVEKVKGSGSSEIDTHSVCKIVTNDAGKQIFVSARTKEEWATHDRSFLKNLPEGVTAKDCPPPPPPPRDDDRGSRTYDTSTGRFVDDDKPKYRSSAKQADDDDDGKVSSGSGGWSDD